MGESLKVAQEMAREYKIMREFMPSPYACKVFFHSKVDLAPVSETKGNSGGNSVSNSTNNSVSNSHGNSPDLVYNKNSNSKLNDDGTGNSGNGKTVEKHEHSYIVMELCEKSNLSGLRKLHSGSYFGIKEGALYGIELIRALKSFHDIGYVHRDIKPVCIMCYVLSIICCMLCFCILYFVCCVLYFYSSFSDVTIRGVCALKINSNCVFKRGESCLKADASMFWLSSRPPHPLLFLCQTFLISLHQNFFVFFSCFDGVLEIFFACLTWGVNCEFGIGLYFCSQILNSQIL